MDKLGAYNEAFNREFYTNRKPQTKHVRLKNIREGTNNNIVERLDERVLRNLNCDFVTVYPGGNSPEILPDGTIRIEWGVRLKPEGPVNGIPNDLCPLRDAKN